MGDTVHKGGRHPAAERIQATVSAHALILESGTAAAEKRILLARLAYRDHRWRKWTFPGGFVDRGETLETALAREIQEEIGIQIHSWKQVAVAPLLVLEKPHIGFVFRCDEWTGNPSCQSRELLEVVWAGREAFEKIVRNEELAYHFMAQQVACLGWHFGSNA